MYISLINSGILIALSLIFSNSRGNQIFSCILALFWSISPIIAWYISRDKKQKVEMQQTKIIPLTEVKLPETMTVKYFAEMMCDRIAASMIYLGEKYTDYSPLEYYYGHKDENKFEDSIRSELEYWLEHLATYGLDYTIRDLRRTIKIEDKKRRFFAAFHFCV